MQAISSAFLLVELMDQMLGLLEIVSYHLLFICFNLTGKIPCSQLLSLPFSLLTHFFQTKQMVGIL
jgi:hypothetical protein